MIWFDSLIFLVRGLKPRTRKQLQKWLANAPTWGPSMAQKSQDSPLQQGCKICLKISPDLVDVQQADQTVQA